MPLGSRFRRSLLVAASLLAVLAMASACGRHTRGKAHVDQAPTAAPVPTPDNTPIDVLRTPAGLVLKTEEPTPAPGHEPTAVPSPAPQVTP